MGALLVTPRRHELLAIQRSAHKTHRYYGAANRDNRIDQLRMRSNSCPY